MRHVFVSYLSFLICSSLSFYINSQQADKKDCVVLVSSSNSDSELLELFKAHISDLVPSNGNSDFSSCIGLLLSSGNYETATFYLEELAARKVPFKGLLKKSINDIEFELKDLYNKYRFSENEFQKVTPVVQWAQSMNNVFLEIKFSHRHDSPGCPEVKNLQVDLSPNSLYLTSYCIQADIPIKFELTLPFFVPINSEESKHDHASNGRYIFNILKGKTGMYWDRLVPEVSDYPKHTKLWLDMHEKYKHELEQYMNEDEDEEFQKLMEEIDKKKKKKKGRKKKVDFDK